MKSPPDNFLTLRALEMARCGIPWLTFGFIAAPTWFGLSLSHAANDEHFK